MSRLRLTVGWVIVGAFVLSIVAALVQNARGSHVDAETLYAAQGLMGILAGALFAKDILRRGK